MVNYVSSKPTRPFGWRWVVDLIIVRPLLQYNTIFISNFSQRMKLMLNLSVIWNTKMLVLLIEIAGFCRLLTRFSTPGNFPVTKLTQNLDRSYIKIIQKSYKGNYRTENNHRWLFMKAMVILNTIIYSVGDRQRCCAKRPRLVRQA